MSESSKRRFPRTMVKILMDYEGDDTFKFILDTEDSEAYLFDYSTNLSEGGIFVKTSHNLPLDAPVHLKFYLPNSDSLIEAKGRVAWVNTDSASSPGPGIGIQFVKLSPESMSIIQEFIRSLDAAGGRP